MMEVIEKRSVDILSTDLSGYEKYLAKLGFTKRHIGFLKLAPKLMFKLYGVHSSVELIKSRGYRAKFLDTISADYCPGTLKKYASGISHYRNYLISEKVIMGSPAAGLFGKKYDPVRLYYQKNKSSYFEGVEKNYNKHLTIEMNYCKIEIRKRTATYQRFASHLIKNGCTSFLEVTGKKVIEFGTLITTYRTDWNKLRPFLKFAYREGYIAENFSDAIIPNRKNRQRRKKYIAQEQIDKLLNSLPRSNVSDKRTYAMFLLMAKLGLRPSETVRVKLKDIDWVNAKILVRGKGNRLDWLPLPSEVAEAIIIYLKQSIRGNSGHVFVQERPPHKPILHTHTLTKALICAYEDTGIKPPSENIRLNVFRHSFATALINKEDQSFFTAQVFLRHSSSEMTLNYAKYHAPKLRLFEKSWPESAK